MNLPDELLAWRIEWKGKGPFWCSKSSAEVIRHARKATPLWKLEPALEAAPTFLEYYCAHASCPYDHPTMEYLLSREMIGIGGRTYGFGFESEEQMHEALGLNAHATYRRQFDALLKGPYPFAVRAYLVRALACHDGEVLFRWDQAQLLEERLCA